MTGPKLANYLKTHRKKSGLSQREVAAVLGFKDGGLISRHERSRHVPPLRHALAYEALFCVPVSILFGGLHETVQADVEAALEELKRHLQSKSGKGPLASLTALKLEWLTVRRRGDEGLNE